MSNKTAASPSEAAQREVRRLRFRLRGNTDPKKTDEAVALALDSFARVEVLRGRLDEHSLTCSYCRCCQKCESLCGHRADLQAQLKEAEEGRS